jgi:hypothetical protein
MTMTTTIKPVTTSGWYENTDGTVSLYTWRNGRANKDQTVASWAEIKTELERTEDIIEAYDKANPAGEIPEGKDREKTLARKAQLAGKAVAK